MADSPNFSSTPWIGVASVSTANTNRDGTGTIVDIGTAAPAAGRKVTSMEFKSTGDLADSVVTVFLHDGTNYHLLREVDVGDPAAGSTTVAAYYTRVTFDDLVLPSGWKICAAITVAPSAGVCKVWAFGGDLT